MIISICHFRIRELLFALFFISVTAIAPAASQAASPVIGILTQPSNGEYIIAASYVKWLEAGGARSIPIPYDAPPSLVEELFGQINGLFLPGGASMVPDSVTYMLTLAMQASASGTDFFPVWGTCLGFEYLVQVISNSSSLLSDGFPTDILTDGFDAENISLPLQQVRQKKLYAEPTMYEIVTNFNVTMNNHFKGVTPSVFEADLNLNELFEITSTNADRKGKEFVSTIEPRHPEVFPWYGVQYHPEKNAFEYATYPGTDIPYEAINHSDRAVDFSTYLARFFVRLTTRNQQQQQQDSIANAIHEYTKPDTYPLVNSYPMKRGLGFEEKFIIPAAGDRQQPLDEDVTAEEPLNLSKEARRILHADLQTLVQSIQL